MREYGVPKRKRTRQTSVADLFKSKIQANTELVITRVVLMSFRFKLIAQTTLYISNIVNKVS